MGEIAAIATALCWTFTSLFFTIGGRAVGSVVLNRLRLAFAVLLLLGTHRLLEGSFLPLGAEPERWWWLGLSGVIGLVLGDAFLFQAFVMVGPRLSTLMMSLVPVISTVLAWLFLGERLSLPEMAAVALTVGGIAWVVLERGNGTLHTDRRYYAAGILAGLGGAAGQALGLIVAKKGLAGDFSPLSGVLIRMLVAAVVMWGFAALRGQASASLRALRSRRALLSITAGSVVGPFLGVWLSLVAVSLTRVGIASTLMALTPIFVLPIARWVLKEPVSGRAVFGTATALTGVAMIFLIG
ncbi:MAG: DMT family transporter [Caldilineae bacterium]|nr:MAG: DMT family transporter [Caldilineae bacterium]